MPANEPSPIEWIEELALLDDEMCGNCGRARWRHHYFSEFGLLCPGNKGVGRFSAPTQSKEPE